jgi:aerotaxis receptor
MWESISSGKSWNGIIKNLRKDGKFYWISLEIIPTKDDKTNEITGYISAGKAASEKDTKDNDILYQKMLEAEE